MEQLKVKLLLVMVIIPASLVSQEISFAQGIGADLFKQKCASCHTIGKGRLVGPDLANVHQKKPEDWLLKWIRSSQTVINSGDEYGKKRFEEFNRTIMPDAMLSDDEIKSVIAYIMKSSEGVTAIETPAVVLSRQLSEATQENIDYGKGLFYGEIRLINGGPACISCHNVSTIGGLGGGRLAIDLSNAYSRLTEPGLVNIIATQPFPVMKQAFMNHPITLDEVFDLAAYLKRTDEDLMSNPQTNSMSTLLYAGFGGAVAMLGLLSLIWSGRNRKPVNSEIYKRQKYENKLFV